jgi:hypothetical protein
MSGRLPRLLIVFAAFLAGLGVCLGGILYFTRAGTGPINIPTAAIGDSAALAAVAKAYRVYYKKVPLDGGDYTMDHTAIVYLMDKDGRFISPFNMKRTADVAAADLKKYL